MTQFFSLQCPTCGAALDVEGAATRFVCSACGNGYLLSHALGAMRPDERDEVRPLVTTTTRLDQWFRVAEYTVRVHTLSEETVGTDRVLYVDAEFRNASGAPMTCRHDQWIVFDRDGYTYEPVKEFAAPRFYEPNGKKYVGMTRILTPGMRLRGWLAFVLPPTAEVEYLQFSGGSPAKSLEFQRSTAKT